MEQQGINIPKQVLMEITEPINTFQIQIEHIKNRSIAAKMMVLLIVDLFSAAVTVDLFPSNFPDWKKFAWDYTEEDKAIIRTAGLALATSLYKEFQSLGLVHQGRVPYVTNRVVGQGLLVLDYMPY